jgi:hypothetical protein
MAQPVRCPDFYFRTIAAAHDGLTIGMLVVTLPRRFNDIEFYEGRLFAGQSNLLGVPTLSDGFRAE